MRTYASRGRGGTGRIGETSVFVQQGQKISELPVVVKKVKDIFEIYRRMGIPTGQQEEEEGRGQVVAKPVTEEETEVMDGFSRCYNSSSIFRLLETIPPSEVTPAVAAHALRKIVQLEESTVSSAPQAEGVRDTIRGVVKRPDTFLRVAFVTALIDIVVASKEPGSVLDALSCTFKEACPGDREVYRDRLLETVLDGVTEGHWSLLQVARAVHTVSGWGEKSRALETADSLWVGLMDQGGSMSKGEEIAAVASCLPLLDRSRSMVLRLLEARVMEAWKELETPHIIEIFRVLTELKYERLGHGFLRTLSGWLTLHMHRSCCHSSAPRLTDF